MKRYIGRDSRDSNVYNLMRTGIVNPEDALKVRLCHVAACRGPRSAQHCAEVILSVGLNLHNFD